MSEERKGLLLHLPQELFEIIKTYKEKTGVSYTNFIYNAIVWYSISRGLISLEYFRKSDEKKNKKVMI